MIMFFRKFSETWIAKFLLILIALSMGGLFGLGQMTSFWGQSNDVIRVGDRAVRPQELARDVDKKAQQMKALTGQYVSIPSLLTMGILPQIISEKVTNLLSVTMIEDLSLAVSSNAVGVYLTNNPVFQTQTGAYDPQAVAQYRILHQMSEEEFVQASKEELLRQQITGALHDIIVAPDKMNDIIYTQQNERRDLETILLPLASVQISSQPTEKELREYYDVMSENLYAPEYRQIQVLRLLPGKIGDLVAVSDEQLRAVYEQNIAAYSTAEKRRVDQILVKDKAVADELFNELTADNFRQIAKEKAGQDEQTTDLGLIAKTEVIEEVGDAAFDAKVGQVLPPIETNFGYHILLVREIEKSTQTPFEKVKDEIKESIQSQKTYDVLTEKSKTLDNALGEGQSLTDAAKLIGMDVTEVVWVDAAGLLDDGKTEAKLPRELVQQVFSLKTGDSSLLYDYEKGFVVAQVQDIKHSTQKEFDQVQDELKAEWKRDQQIQQAQAFSDKVFAEAKQAKDFAALAKKYNLETENLNDVRRADVQKMSPQIIADLFDAKQGNVLLVPVSEHDHIIVKVAKITPADKEDTVSQALFKTALDQQLAESLYQEILLYYGQKNKVEINQELIAETFKQYTQNSK